MIDKSFIDTILEIAKPELVKVDGRTAFSSYGRITELLPPFQTAIEVPSLQSIVDYLSKKADGVNTADVIIHVVDPCVVAVYSDVDPMWKRRHLYITANHKYPVFKFGQWFGPEEFVINVQSQFVQDENSANILRIVGNLADENVTTYADDGVTQGVNQRTGVARVGATTVPNPITLRPFRTFSEVKQPASSFVFRLRPGRSSGDLPSAALFEADGWDWKVEARRLIKDWLRSQLLPVGDALIIG